LAQSRSILLALYIKKCGVDGPSILSYEFTHIPRIMTTAILYLRKKVSNDFGKQMFTFLYKKIPEKYLFMLSNVIVLIS